VMNQVYQWPTYAPALHGMGLAMSDERDELSTLFSKGVAALQQGDCPGAFALWNSVWNDDGGAPPGKFFEMTGSTFPESALLAGAPAEWKPYKAWLATHPVRQMLHADGIPTSSSKEGGMVYDTMVKSGDWCSNSSDIYASLFVKSQLDLLIFSSTVDALLGAANTEAGVTALFEHAASTFSEGALAKAEFGKARKAIWKVDSTKDVNVAGFAKCIAHPTGTSRFCFSLVKNAGHEMPSYQPRAALDLYQRFMAGRSWNSTGDRPEELPKCAQCGGVAPFAGPALPACATAGV